MGLVQEINDESSSENEDYKEESLKKSFADSDFGDTPQFLHMINKESRGFERSQTFGTKSKKKPTSTFGKGVGNVNVFEIKENGNDISDASPLGEDEDLKSYSEIEAQDIVKME